MATVADRTLEPDHDLPFVARYRPAENWIDPVRELHSGDVCPQCLIGRIDYDGMLNLTCNQCAVILSGGSGCT